MVGGRAPQAAGALVLAVATAAAAAGCGGAEPGNAQRGVEADSPTTEAAGAGAAEVGPVDLPPGLTAAGQGPADDRLTMRPFAFGECVTYPHDGEGREVATVDCDGPHDLQMTRSVTIPDQARYPSDDQWQSFITTACAAPAEDLVGRPIDPYGRLAVTAFRPLADSWEAGDRTVWCAVGAQRASPDDEDPQLTEDVRALRDQSVHFVAGDCLTNSRQPRHAVPCDQPHELEVTGTVDFPDGGGPPAGDEVDPRCVGLADRYAGGTLRPPWEATNQPLAPESWAAGQRYTHCFVAQFDPASGAAVAVTVSARG